MANKNLITFESPMSLEGQPKACVELIIYDNDGPEGYFKRLRFERSSEAIQYVIDCFDPEEIKDYNFEITNYWVRKTPDENETPHALD